MAGNRPGRKPKLNADLERRLLGLLRAGVPREIACAGVGIASRTLRIWLERASKGEARFVRFAEAVEEAIGEAQASMLVQLRRHGERDPKALMWMLEHVYSARFGRVHEMREAKRLESKEVQRGPAQVELTLKHEYADPDQVHASSDVGASSVQPGK